MANESLDTKSDGALVQYVVDEIARFHAMTWEEKRKASKPPSWDLSYSVKNKHGVEFICGRNGHHAIAILVDRALSDQQDLKNRCSFNSSFQLYKKYFLKFLAKENYLDLEKLASRYATLITRLQRLRRKNLRFGVPCTLPITSEEGGYRLGGVEFIRMREWLDMHDSEKGGSDHISEYTRIDLLKYPWIAFVTVKKTEPERGQVIAESAVEGIINLIRIYLVQDGEWDDVPRLGHVGGRLMPKEKVGVAERDGKLSIWYSRKAHPNVGDDFLKFLESHDYTLQILATPVRSIVDGDAESAAGRRFLDALKWFGEASAEEQGGAQIVKAVMCMERLTIFEEGGKGIKERVSKRVAMLISVYGDGEYLSCRDEVGLAYKLRSDLMHGSIGPFETKFSVKPYRVLKIAAETLICFVCFLARLSPGQREGKELLAAYKKMVGQIDPRPSTQDS